MIGHVSYRENQAVNVSYHDSKVGAVDASVDRERRRR